MNHGSIETRSSAASALEQLGVRAPSSEFSYRPKSTSPDERFDSIFDSLQQRSGNDAQNGVGDRELCGSSSSSHESQDIEKSVPEQEMDVEVQESELEKKATSDVEKTDSKLQESEAPKSDASSEETSAVSDDESEVAASEQSVPTEGKAEDVQPQKKAEKPVAGQAVQALATKAKGDENRAIKTPEQGKLSSSKSFQLQNHGVTIVKDADAEKSAKTTVVKNETAKPAVEAANKPVGEIKPVGDTKPASEMKPAVKGGGSATVQSVKQDKELVEALDKIPAKATKIQKGTNHANATSSNANMGASKFVSEELKADAEQNGKAAVKKSSHNPAKTSTGNHEAPRTSDPSYLKSPLNSVGLPVEGRLARLEQEIGIKTAEQAVNKHSKMVTEVRNSESAGSEKGFLKETNPNGTLNRAQAVTSRADSGGFFSNSQYGGQQNHGDAQSGGRGGEQYRQWVEGNSEVRGVAQAAQQGDFVDRAVGSALSARVVNQIMSHIDRLRDSEKNRVKVSLGSEANGVTVDIRIDGDAIYTSFEGDPQILNQLKEEWDDIKDRASQRGVALNDPEFIEISYSSSSESESFLPDDDIAKEEKSQSVIQHTNNQPVRPVEMTAAAGSSGPVHSFYA